MIAIETEATNTNVAPSREFLERQAFEAFKAFVLAFQRLVEAPNVPTAQLQPVPTTTDPPTKDVMTA